MNFCEPTRSSLGCEVIAIHGPVAEPEGTMNLRHGVMKPTVSVGQTSTHSLRSIAVNILIIKYCLYPSKIND